LFSLLIDSHNVESNWYHHYCMLWSLNKEVQHVFWWNTNSRNANHVEDFLVSCAIFLHKKIHIWAEKEEKV
jgi:hypothetical protein